MLGQLPPSLGFLQRAGAGFGGAMGNDQPYLNPGGFNQPSLAPFINPGGQNQPSQGLPPDIAMRLLNPQQAKMGIPDLMRPPVVNPRNPAPQMQPPTLAQLRTAMTHLHVQQMVNRMQAHTNHHAGR